MRGLVRVDAGSAAVRIALFVSIRLLRLALIHIGVCSLVHTRICTGRSAGLLPRVSFALMRFLCLLTLGLALLTGCSGSGGLMHCAVFLCTRRLILLRLRTRKYGRCNVKQESQRTANRQKRPQRFLS